ncbi:MAG: efflux RND transporter periplasmic adaptor subunit [Opitutales bacterium]|jgi:multidrug efflux pump subunit AcrA (membrane-fusion protein)|nr:efflux RND transporter periplasmic adaptor subunit [Opitutales bacterium]MBT5170090.1 efflux RND transporter periplasmic adaptor subunit [Opitutales bacterium]MBT5814436.1 efflux RND transporter periplasmic adaptor subunit [Opitutales bacterium]MBT6768885.1 efflux RND transporter periplasmic adaptor subunit [Opitutales bacterium]MDG2254118.1 efflux RND transporter periplasmic adaptor subunit [Opitutaceae bacterium]
MKTGLVFKILIPIALVSAAGFYILNESASVAVVAKVERHLAVNAVPSSVSVVAEKEMLIKGEHGGRIAVSKMEKGGLVSFGEVLMALDTGDLDLLIEKADNDIASANRRIEIGSALQIDLDVKNDLLSDVEYRFSRGGVREIDVTNAKRAVKKVEDDIARSDLQNETLLLDLENKLKSLNRQKDQMMITSPIDGIVTEIYAHEGDLIGGGSTLAKVVSLTRMVEAKVSEEYFVGLKVGMPARVAFLGIENERFDAKIERVIPVADAQTQRFTVLLDVEIADNRLDSGLTGDATITLDERENAMQVPRQALVNDAVLVVENETVSRRPVRLGYKSVTMLEILEGLSDDDVVIVEDIHLFEEGERVKVVYQD